MNNPEDYRAAFDGEFNNRNARIVSAFEKAVDTRKFEIDLYWKRATYFWALIAVAFAGYFAMQTAKDIPSPDRSLFSFVISCIGFFFTVAWFLVNKGSKFWQENWENHVALLSEQITGPLYVWVLCRPGKPTLLESVTAPAAISVSKVNSWVSLYVILIWVGLMLHSATLNPVHCLRCVTAHPYAWIGAFTGLMTMLMYFCSKTHLGVHRPRLVKMSTRITEE